MRKPQLLAALACVCLAVLAAAQTTDTSKRLRVSSGVAEGLKTHTVDPIYPAVARQAGIYGDVVLHATIDTNGKISSIRPVQGDPILVKASIDAVKQWRYRPYVFNGKPVEVETTILIKFHM
ncbi:MAG TPA: energy transducer TonB [Candidatus Angelobacter sp.]|nr:energy transducer TonB [Candidatus Angelobacter sp.]